jgi:hypothetical protein
MGILKRGSKTAKKSVTFKGDLEVNYYDVRMAPVISESPTEWLRIYRTGTPQERDNLVRMVYEGNRPNSALELEKAGSRLATVEEIDRFCNSDGVGLRFLVETSHSDDIKKDRKLIEAALKKFVTKKFLRKMSDTELFGFMEQCLAEDFEDAKSMKQILLVKELTLRGLPIEGSMEEMVRQLRKRIEIEQTLEGKFGVGEVPALDANAVLKEGLQHRLRCLGLNESGDLDQLALRLELWRLLQQSCKVKFAEVDVQELNSDELAKELKARKIVHEGDRKELVNKVRQAWAEDSIKFPLKYEFGSTSIDPEELVDLHPDFIHLIASRLDESLSDADYISQLAIVKELIMEQSELAMLETLNDWLEEVDAGSKTVRPLEAFDTSDSMDSESDLHHLSMTLANVEEALIAHRKSDHVSECEAFLCVNLKDLLRFCRFE